MSVKALDSKEVQDLLKAAANFGSRDGNTRAKQFVIRPRAVATA
jgi:catechol 1,2-dioxygenase